MHRANQKLRVWEEEVKAAVKHNLHLIACKELEKVWRSKRMIPQCPHCKTGLLPEDFASIHTRVSAEIERQRRTNKKKETL